MGFFTYLYMGYIGVTSHLLAIYELPGTSKYQLVNTESCAIAHVKPILHIEAEDDDAWDADTDRDYYAAFFGPQTYRSG